MRSASVLAALTVALGTSCHRSHQTGPAPRVASPALAHGEPRADAVDLVGLGLSPDFPTDLPSSPRHPDAVRFAWRAFVAANWPALAGQRGEPDRSRAIGQPGSTVWESWKRPFEVFLSDGARPADWEQYGGAVPPECQGAEPTSKFMFRVSKSLVDSDNPVFERNRQAIGGTLTDQHGLLARYELAFNKPSFDYIVNNTLYNVQGQGRFAGPVAFEDGTMEVKAAWRQFTAKDSPAIRARYYQQQAYIYIPASGSQPAQCTLQAVGLVGMHVSRKTPSRPQWIWATFEHVDNVPPFGTETPGSVAYSFNDPSCPPSRCRPNKSTEKDDKPTGVPTQVTRVVDIGSDAAAANPGWQRKLAGVPGSPWQYYQLIDVQWPSKPRQMPFGSPYPGLVANTTMETYVPESSCLKCHSTASTRADRPSDYSYLLAEAHEASTGGQP